MGPGSCPVVHRRRERGIARGRRCLVRRTRSRAQWKGANYGTIRPRWLRKMRGRGVGNDDCSRSDKEPRPDRRAQAPPEGLLRRAGRLTHPACCGHRARRGSADPAAGTTAQPIRRRRAAEPPAAPHRSHPPAARHRGRRQTLSRIRRTGAPARSGLKVRSAPYLLAKSSCNAHNLVGKESCPPLPTTPLSSLSATFRRF